MTKSEVELNVEITKFEALIQSYKIVKLYLHNKGSLWKGTCNEHHAVDHVFGFYVYLFANSYLQNFLGTQSAGQ